MDNSQVKSNFKGYYGCMKAIVVDTQDPSNWGRVKVRIPEYHGTQVPDSDLPWAQVSVPILHKDNTDFISKLLSLLGLNMESYAIRPNVNDKIWIMCEDGDIRYPVYLGVLCTTNNPEVTGDSCGDSSSSSSDIYVTGGNLAAIAAQVVSSQEGDYDSIAWDDAGASSLGKFQWRAGRAKQLLNNIRSANQASFDSIISKCGASDFVKNSLQSSASWDSFCLGEGSARGNAVKEILGTSTSHSVQDSLMQADCQGYINAGKGYGLHDNGALIFFADCYNQNPAGAVRIAKIAAANGGSLAAIHNAALEDHVLGKYAGRRNSVYNKILQLQQEGKLNGTNGDLTSSVSTTGGKMPWPVEGNIKTITSGYGYRAGPTKGGAREFHHGIDISGYHALGTPIIATISGTAYTQHLATGYGNAVFLQSGNMQIVFGHMEHTSVSNGQNVTAGTVIGALGTSGDSTGPHLHFEIRVGGKTSASSVNPLPYLSST
jgi:murein DD-endopeptidase MepM/ murein hydrolase activator NlpD